ncbi:LOW QUALITY PROTEIN: hypothetical protein U9M48_013252 [Paspalum notatum var. saurae]|uniref:Integrase catalytic domain-containing protein n=1 Tax=Paspalum notatum var. saurae TaxID=547442 RepID=A0AAQ3T061_PASNO
MNASTTFQALMNDVLQSFLHSFVLVFFDDILIYNTSWTKHFSMCALCSLCCASMASCASNPSASSMGNMISRNGVATDEGKVHTVIDWPLPRSVRALRGFLGLADYYRMTMGPYSAPHQPTLQGQLPLVAAADKAFQRLRVTLTTAPVLTLQDFALPFMVECNASSVECGTVLHQGAGPMAFLSRPIVPRHRGLAAYERELIGLIQAMRHWRPYLWGRRFHVKTGHYSLKFLLDQHRWVSKLLGFDFTVEYKPRSTNVVDDVLSRRDAESCMLLVIFEPSFAIVDDLRPAASTDPALVSLVEQVVEGTLRAPWSLVDGPGVEYDATHEGTLLYDVHDATHEGVENTLRRFCHDFHTPRERAVVQEFVHHCLCNKTKHHHPARLLLHLPVPTTVWSDVSMDFVEGLPKVGVSDFKDLCALHRVIASLLHNSTKSVAAAIFREIVRVHGIPVSIVSDCDSVFTSAFWQSLFKHLGTKLHMSSTFHPQSDGQTEVVNKAIGMYLHCLTGDRPRQWLNWLPWVEFVYNTSFQSA